MDNIPTVLEYFLDLDPTLLEPLGSTYGDRVLYAQDSGMTVEVSPDVVKDDDSIDDQLIVIFEYTSDLKTWIATPYILENSDPGQPILTATPPAASSDAQYMRLRVSFTP